MVGAFAPYTIKRRRVEIVRGYCYRFIQCSFPCGIIMLIFSLLFIILGASQLIYIFHFNGCNTSNTRESESGTTDIISISSSSFKCNRQAMKVLGITFVVSGSVLFFISLLVTKYSRSSEENNVIRTTTTSLITNNTKHNPQHHHHYHHHYPPHSKLSSEHDQNHIIVSTR
jgi:hypothetical protein